MANSARDIHIGLTGQIQVAEVGTTMPTDATSPVDRAFVDLGYTTPDGLRLAYNPETQEIEVWQSEDPVRVFATRRPASVEFQLAQLDENTMPIAFGGGTVTPLGGDAWQYSPPQAGDALAERAAVLDVEDGDKRVRIVIPRAVITEPVEVTFSKEAPANLPVTLRVLKPDSGSSWGVFFDVVTGS